MRTETRTAFRADIEGLRALAVLAVILGHAETPGFAGGYLGVDIFFVISGFLITGIISRDIGQKTFSLAKFYERRARRIIPALLVVIYSCLPVALIFMSSESLKSFGQSVISTIIFSNNILLLLTAGYWDQGAAFKPLLHTWSLGVEEQFYLVFPLVLMVVAKRPQSAVALFSAMLLASLASGAILSPRADFYLLPGRAWELLAGALVALAPTASEKVSTWLAIIGPALVVLAIGSASPDPSVPSWPALAAVSGTAALLAISNSQTPAARLLGSGPMVAIGGMSYSLYLWHQPLFAFLRLLSFAPPSFGQYLPLFPLLALLAWLSTRFVEKRYRDPQAVSRRRLVAELLAGTLILATIGLGLHLSVGLPERHDATSGFRDGELDPRIYNGRVYQFVRQEFTSDGRRRVLLLGNSRARDFGNVMIEAGALRSNQLAYREDLYPCNDPFTANELLRGADFVVIEASLWRVGCIGRLVPQLRPGVQLLVLGPRQFGYSIEPYLRLSQEERTRLRIKALPEYAQWNRQLASEVPAPTYVNYFAILSGEDDWLPLFDSRGKLLSIDRMHLTRAGAIFVGQALQHDQRFAWLGANALDRSH